jgi:eukaryotic-like serine/threonine-protein kinase
MSTCPSTQRLIHLLDEELNEPEISEIFEHVQGCLGCQTRLDEITRGRLAEIVGIGPAVAHPATQEEAAAAFNRTLSPDGTMDGKTCPSMPTTNGQQGVPETMTEAAEETTGFSSARLHQPLDPSATCDLHTETRLDADPASEEPNPGTTTETKDDEATDDLQPAGPDATGGHDRIGSTQPGGGNSATAPLTGGMPKIPGYELLEKLGQGGMGVVYKARQVGLNRLVAVKMIRGGEQARPEQFVRFRVEAEAVARLRHPNIIQVHDIGAVDELPFVSLELLDGGDLADRLAGSPQPGRAAAELLVTLAQAIEVAHQAGIVHRDLKPTNILFTADGVPKITDFGLAKRLESDSNQTETGQIMGSPSYMAPEQARGHTKDVGPPADLYALGAIFYEMLTGRPPFKGETPIETIRQVTDDEVVPPSRLVPRVARDLETICLKCLNKEPQKRYPSAQALAEDLQRFLRGEPIKARPTPLLERVAKWARRRPVAASVAGMGFSSFVGLTIGGALYEHNQRILEANQIRLERSFHDEGNSLIDQARQSATVDELAQAELQLSTFSERIKPDAHLANLKARVEEALALVAARLKDERSREATKESDRQSRARFQHFRDLRSQAQLLATGFGVSGDDRVEKLRTSVREALAIYARDPRLAETEWTLTDPLPAVRTRAEQSQVSEGSYDLLLELSQHVEPAVGLRILGQALRLHPAPTAAFHLRRADCLARAGDRTGRDREEQLAREYPPVSALDHYLVGREHYLRREFPEALSSFDTAVRLDPDQTGAQLLLALSEYNVRPKRLGEARYNLGTVIRGHPDLPGLYLLRALIQGEEAVLALAAVDPQGPGESAALKQQAAAAFKAAEADYASVLERQPGADYRHVLLVNRGTMFLQAGQLDRSLADLEAAIGLKPADHSAYMSLALLHQRQGRVEAASLAFARAIERTKDSATKAALYRSRALLFSSRKDLPADRRIAAIADLDEAIRLQPPDSPEAAGNHVERARLLLGGGRHEEALAACAVAIQLVPDHAEAHRLRISSLLALNRHGEVLSSCQTYLAREKPTVEILEMSGLARLAAEDHAGAIDDFTRALGLHPEPALAVKTRLLNRRGWAHHFTDAPRLALFDFEASLRLVKDQSDALGGRGLARIRLGQWRPAVADAEAAVRLARAAPPASGDPDLDLLAQADFNAARIYAQAVEFAAREVSREGERAVSLYRRYRARSLELLDQALRQIPDASRRREFLDDPALKPLRLKQVTTR